VYGLCENLKEIAFHRRIIEQARCVHIAGEKNDSGSGTERTHCFRQLNPVEVWHYNVRNNNVWAFFLDRFKSVSAALCGNRREAAAIENCRDTVGNQFLIVHDEDPPLVSVVGGETPLLTES
jgi:hypothetical protein